MTPAPVYLRRQDPASIAIFGQYTFFKTEPGLLSFLESVMPRSYFTAIRLDSFLIATRMKERYIDVTPISFEALYQIILNKNSFSRRFARSADNYVC